MRTTSTTRIETIDTTLSAKRVRVISVYSSCISLALLVRQIPAQSLNFYMSFAHCAPECSRSRTDSNPREDGRRWKVTDGIDQTWACMFTGHKAGDGDVCECPFFSAVRRGDYFTSPQLLLVVPSRAAACNRCTRLLWRQPSTYHIKFVLRSCIA